MSELKVGKRFCQCSGCGEYFNSVKPFDMHRISLRTGGRGCETVEGMVIKGMSKNAAGYWVGAEMTESEKKRIRP
jgi:hypothetical protein